MKNLALKYTLIFAAVGAVITMLIGVVERGTFKTYQHNLPYVNLAENVNNRTNAGVAQFERLMKGDNTIKINEDILSLFSSSTALLTAAYEGKETSLGDFKKTTDEDTRVILKQTLSDLGKLSEVTKLRWQAMQTLTNADSASLSSAQQESIEADQQFTAAYLNTQTAIDKLKDQTVNNLKSDIGYLNLLSWVSLVLLLVAVVLLCIFLYRLQRGRDKMEQTNSARMEAQASSVQALSSFIAAISEGNYKVDLQLGEEEGNNLSSTLIAMRNTLRENAQNDDKRNWATSGQAQVGEILRTSTGSTAELYDNIIRFVVKYTKSNQGGMFILNDENQADKYLDLVACYAFERKKYSKKRIDVGQGIVGQCFLEGESIYMVEVPQDYVSITSGLGGTNPTALLVVPMKVNGQVYGAIELASFAKYQPHEIELVEKFADSIASTISTVKVNETTRILLEKTQQQAEEMKSQEEEIRQNMEELEATQEEMRRKQTILEKELSQSQEQAGALKLQERKLMDSQDTLQAIVDNIPRAIFWKDKDLRFMGCNKIFSDIAGLNSTRDIVGKSDHDMAWSAQADLYRQDDMEVMNSRKAKLDIEEVNINSQGEESWVSTSKVPIIDTHGVVVAVLGMFEDITGRKQKDAEIVLKLQEREVAMKELQQLKQVLELRKD